MAKRFELNVDGNTDKKIDIVIKIFLNQLKNYARIKN